MTHCPYTILNITKDASDDDIKKAYRKLILQYHPDKNNSSDANARFIEIQAAYDLLKDKTRREHYNSQAPQEQSAIFSSLYKFFAQRYPDYVQHIVKSFYDSESEFNNDITEMNIEKIYNHVIDKLPNYLDSVMPKHINLDVTIIQRFNNDTLYYDSPSGVIEVPSICDEYVSGQYKFTLNLINNNVFQQVGPDVFITQTIPLHDYLYGGTFTLDYIDGRTHIIKFNSFINKIPTTELDNMGLPYYVNKIKLRGKLIILYDIKHINDPNFKELIRSIY